MDVSFIYSRITGEKKEDNRISSDDDGTEKNKVNSTQSMMTVNVGLDMDSHRKQTST